MNNTNYIERAIQLVSINSFGKLMLHAEAVDFLRSLNSPTAITTITGPTNTGKSFLMNQLVSQQDAFQVGYNNIPTTKGLWLWSKPVLAYND
jgi:type II secretory ATPase GspE/PulE/Tfp pilus assembly ATPase PilB-like protein